jgi:ketosteroid isomerase-like protein
MSQENVEFVTGIFAAAGDMDKAAVLKALPELVPQLCDPDIEWIEDPRRADSRTYRGHDGVIESWRQWLDTFAEHDFEIDRITDCGGDDVFVAMTELGTGARSGAPSKQRTYAVLTVKDGKVRRYREFSDEQTALEAAGLSE